MNEPLFNPFTDRLSRDLRNDLSEGLASAVLTGDHEKLEKILFSYRVQLLAECYRQYLEDRSSRFEKALSAIGRDITDPLHRGLILWDLGLFFEMHEVLEHAWYSAHGAMKLTLQAMIRAAGVYIKREHGYHDAARKIAQKAVPVLIRNEQILIAFFDPKVLTDALLDPASVPPKLLSKKPR